MNIEALNSVATFAECVWEPTDIIEVRLLPGRRSQWYAAGDLAGKVDDLDKENRRKENVYVGGNPRKTIGGTDAEDVAIARCLWVDWDGGCTEQEARAKIIEAELPAPTVMLASGGGVHAYWRMAVPITDLAEFTRLQKKLIAATGADGSIHDPPRIMRLPGFLNVKPKYNPPPRCRILEADASRRWTLQEIVGHLPDAPLPTAPPPSNGTAQHTELTATARAMLFIDRIPGASEGEGRNNAAYKAAAAMVKDFALSTSEAAPLLATWNKRNNPPLDDAELMDVLASANRHGDHTNGQKLNEQRKDTHQHNGSTSPRGTKEKSGGHHLWEQIEAPISYVDFRTRFPKLTAPRIDGLQRHGEVMNLIATTKVGKSWTTYEILWRLVTGGKLWNLYNCAPCNVLLIDNELHPEVLSDRLPRVKAALGIKDGDIQGQLSVQTLRGRLLDFDGARCWLEKHVKPGQFQYIIFDAYYRLLPAGVSENENGEIAQIANKVDAIARDFDAALLLVHHATKGNQSGKSVTDVGSGASAMARAADTHLVLRPHEEEGVVVGDAALRSFPPVDSFCLRWDFPLWKPVDNLDATKLKTAQPKASLNQIAERVFACLRDDGPQTKNKVRERTRTNSTNVGDALNLLQERGHVEPVDVKTTNGTYPGFQVVSSTPDNPGHVRSCTP